MRRAAALFQRTGHEKTHHRNTRPCRRGQNDPLRGPFVCRGRAAHARPRRSRRRLSGHRSARTRARHHHLCQAGGARLRRHAHHAARYAGPRRFLRRSGAHPTGARLRDPCHQRHGRRAGPHPHALAAAGALRRTDVPLHQQDGPCGRGPRGAADGSAKELRRVRRSQRGAERARRARRADRRSGSRGAAGARRAFGRHARRFDLRAENFPLLLRLRAQK